MASSGPIGGDKIFKKGLTKTAIDDFEKLNQQLNTTEAILKAIGGQAEKFLKAAKTPVDSDSLKKRNQQIEILKKSTKGLGDVEKERLKLRARLKQANSEAIKQNTELKIQIQEQTKANKQIVNENPKMVGAFAAQTNTLKRLRKEFKNAALSEGEFSKKAVRLLKDVRKLETGLNKVNSTASASKRAFDKATGAVGNFGRNIAGALGITAGLTGLVRIFKSSISIFVDFEKANSNLRAVLNGTNEEMKALAESSKELGATTAFTATEVTELNISLAKLGFPTEDILQMNEAILSGAAAMGSDLGETATLVGATLRSFGLDASETGRVVDVLAKSTSSSALDFNKLNASMSTIAPVANKFGFSLEATTSLLGQLSNAGFDASSAATATRNILLNLADTNGKLAKSLKEPVKDLPSLVKGLKQLKDEGIDLGEALQLTDKRSVAAFATFLDGTDAVLELNEKLEQAGGTAQKMADTQLNNLAGATTILNSAWEGFILSLDDGNGSFSRLLKTVVKGTTALLGFLTPTESLGKETQKLTKEFEDQEEVLNPLLERYDELKELGELNTEQQAELEGVINDIVEIVPEAATGFDIYGNALDINRDKVIANTEAQRNLLAELAGQDIEGIGESFIGATQDIIIYQEQLEKGIRQTAEMQKVTGELRRELTVPEARTAAIDIRNLDSQIQENIQTLIKFGLTQEEIIDLFDKSGNANKAETQRFIENLNAVLDLNKAKKEEAELDNNKIDSIDEETESTESQIRTLKILRQELSDLKKIRQDIDITDKEGLKNNKKEIEDLQKFIDLIEGNIKGTNKLTDAEKALVKAMEDELKARKALEKQKEIDAKLAAQEFEDNKKAQAAFEKDAETSAKIAAEELSNKQELADFDKELSEFSEELQQDEFDTFVEFQESGFATFAEFEEAKRKELEETAKIEAENRQRVIDAVNEVADITIEAINRRADAAKQANDEEIQRRQDNLANLEQLSKEGQQITEGQRAFEAQKLAEAQVEKARLEEQEKNRQLAISVAKAFNSALESEEPAKALLTALATVGAETVIVNSLFTGGAYDGTDSIDDSNAMFKIPGRDPYLVPLRKGEMVLTPEEQAKSGITKRSDIHEAFAQNKLLNASMLYSPKLAETGVTMNSIVLDNSGVIAKLDKVEKAIKSQKSSVGLSVNDVNQIVEVQLTGSLSNVITHLSSTLSSQSTRTRG